MSSFCFHLRPSARPGLCEGSIFIRLIHERKVKEISTGYRVFPDEWDHLNHWLKIPDTPNPRTRYLHDIGEHLQRDAERISSIIKQLKAGGYYTTEDIKALFVNAPRSNMLTVYGALLIQRLECNGQSRTARAYLTVIRGMLKFCDQSDLPLEEITVSLMRRYEQWMRDSGKSMNTISFCTRNLRAIYHKAVHERVIPPAAEDPFKVVYTGIASTKKRALNEEEIKRIWELDSLCRKQRTQQPNRLNSEQRDAYAYFMFSFFSRGMSGIDMAYLKKANISNGKISYCRKKTGGSITITLTYELKSIVDYFTRRTAGSPYVFPIIDSKKENPRLQYESFLRKQNILLKELAQLAKVYKPVSTHVARHSWATIARKSGASTACISEGLGHKDEKTTRIYLDSFNPSAIDEVSRLVCRAIQ